MKELVAVLMAALVLAGCNTMAGLGKDIERTGEKIQDKAKK
jgi:predicted small secreted protein